MDDHYCLVLCKKSKEFGFKKKQTKNPAVNANAGSLQISDQRGKDLPGSQLVLAPPGELSEALVALVVVVEHPVQRGGAQVHQSVVGRLLLLPAGVAVEQVVDLIGDLCRDENNRMSTRTRTSLAAAAAAANVRASQVMRDVSNQRRAY